MVQIYFEQRIILYFVILLFQIVMMILTENINIYFFFQAYNAVQTSS